jgi:Ca2+-binding RTX toxin-like protein
MEKVEIGAAVGKLNVEDTALQLLNNHYYLNTAGTIIGKDLRAGQTADNVIVDASAMKANGLTFEGNANNNTFIGTLKDDTFIGNGGNDTLTGGDGADKFVFGQVHTQTVSGDATSIQTYKDVASNLSGVDTITDFK